SPGLRAGRLPDLRKLRRAGCRDLHGQRRLATRRGQPQQLRRAPLAGRRGCCIAAATGAGSQTRALVATLDPCHAVLSHGGRPVVAWSASCSQHLWIVFPDILWTTFCAPYRTSVSSGLAKN